MAETRYAFNVSRQAFINLGVKVADTPWARLRGLLGRMKLRSDEGLWVVPSRGIHTIGLLFPIDVIYLDPEFRVVHLIEDLRPMRIAPLRFGAASVLELPTRTIEASGTKMGDLIMIRSPEEICETWAKEEDRKLWQKAV
jgi:uncharacterized membrane protein (UPF0127 family)